jgi:hypothetical protein
MGRERQRLARDLYCNEFYALLKSAGRVAVGMAILTRNKVTKMALIALSSPVKCHIR